MMQISRDKATISLITHLQLIYQLIMILIYWYVTFDIFCFVRYVREKVSFHFREVLFFQLKVLEGREDGERAVTMIMAIIAAISATIATVEIAAIVAISTDIYNLFFSTAPHSFFCCHLFSYSNSRYFRPLPLPRQPFHSPTLLITPTSSSNRLP